MNIIHNEVIRKIILAFGNIFSQLPLVRYKDGDTQEFERFVLSLIYAPKEQYVHRLQDDPDLDSRVQVIIPSLSYEMVGLKYDASRKQITNIKNFSQTPQGTFSQYNPVPYDFDFELNLYSRTFEDAHQVVEHILAYFTPDYTIKVNLIPALGVIREIPILLDSVDRSIDFEGDRDSGPRRIIFTFHFTVKGFIFGKVTDASGKLIKHSITSIYNEISSTDAFKFYLSNTGSGTYLKNEFVYQGYDSKYPTASATVVTHDKSNNILELTSIHGDFIPSDPLIGSTSHASYLYTSTAPSPGKMAQIDIRVNPYTANVSDNWTANTIITEFQ
jgi:hypothetical protein